MRICFVDPAKLEYSFKDLYDKKIRGGESSIINISKKLSEIGHDVYVFNNCKTEFNSKRYKWFNIKRLINFKDHFEAIISNNDNIILNKIKCEKKYVLSHSILTFEKSVRKKQLYSYFLNKPKYLLLGNYHKKKMSKIFSFFGNHIINYGVDDIFTNKKLIKNIDKNLAFFTSRQDRNLDLLIQVWKKNVFPERNKSKLYITPIPANYEKFNIFNRKMLNRTRFIDELLKSRMIILPGHKAELHCIAALEASELCIPIVTMGIGSLSERIVHGKTGLISKTKRDFASNIIELFDNNSLWRDIKINLYHNRGKKSWTKACQKLIKIIKE